MLFSSMVFLWVFLPIVLCVYKVLNQKYKNIFLLTCSLVFYAWGEPKYIVLMIFSIIINYYFGIKIEKENIQSKQKLFLTLCIIINLSLLTYFKYFNFFIENINALFAHEVITTRNIILPIGISFYTFQALSYVVDVYRSKRTQGKLRAQKNILDLGLYISLFPQLIAGPIIKYNDIEEQIYKRKESIELTAYGVKRFIYGISKKVLISNIMASTADEIFALAILDITTPMAWIRIISYTLQIYYDFSGYSDMAIGLGAMFGFDFIENFNYPYVSKSIQDFWKRWHISLSTWFKEYLYIPLGGNRRGVKKTYINLLIVFFATGLWHGASWTFIIWGLYHGMFLVMERAFLGKILKENKFKILNNAYVLVVVMIGWVFFRSENLTYSFGYIKRLFVITQNSGIYNLKLFFNIEALVIMAVGILLAGVLQQNMGRFKNALYNKNKITYVELITCTILMLACVISLVSGAYNPFIYFRF